jgi:hypothetical protein
VKAKAVRKIKIAKPFAKQPVRKSKISDLLSEYACWTLENEMVALTKAEDLCVMANILKMEASGRGFYHSLLSAPLKACKPAMRWGLCLRALRGCTSPNIERSEIWLPTILPLL